MSRPLSSHPGCAAAVGLFRSRRFTDAAESFAAIGGADAGQDCEAVLSLAQARAWALAHHHDAAQAAAGRAIGLDPDMLRAHLLLSRIAAATGDRAGSIAHLRRATALRPAAVGLRVRLARDLLATGRPKEALAAAREALSLDPQCESACFAVAECHIAHGNPTLARLAVARLHRERPEQPALQPFRTPDHRPGDGHLAEAIRPADIAARVVHAPAPPGPARSVGRAPRRPPSLLDDLLIIRACMLRGFAVRHTGNPFWLPLELVRPTCVVVAHWVLFAVLHKPMPGEIPIPLFVLAGFSVWFAFNYAAIGAANGANTPAGALAWPGVTTMHLRLSRALWPLMINFAFCVLATIPFRLARSDLPLPALPLTVLVFTVAGLGGIGYGLLAERLASIFPAFGIAEKLLSWLLFVTCGLYFVVYQTTPLLAQWLLYNPLLHLIDYQRHAFDPGYPVGLVDLRYPIAIAATVLTLGLAACRAWPVRRAGSP